MALYTTLYKSHLMVSRYLLAVTGGRLLKFFVRNHGDKSIAIDSDVLDDFTTQLMQRKSDKWEVMRTRRKLDSEQKHFKYSSRTKENKVKIEYLDKHEINTFLLDAIEANNTLCVKQIMTEYIESKRLPPLLALLQVLSFYSQNGDKDTILDIVQLCKEIQPEVLKDHSNFKHYLAEAIWVKGNINESLMLFEDVYRNNAYLRRRIRAMLKCLMIDAIANRSEPALHHMISFAEQLVDDFRDFYPLACIWQACFLSKWFTDQCIALDLLKKKEGLCKAVANQLPYIVVLALKNHQTEVVYRLLEILLELELKFQYKRILEALFDYRVRQGDLRGCSEIIQWSLMQGIELPSIQGKNFVKLLISYASDSTHILEANSKEKPSSTPSVHFKF